MDHSSSTAATCPGCGVALAAFHVAHFEAGRRSTTLELLCPTHACEHHAQPDGHTGRPPTGAVPEQRRHGG